MPFRIRALDPAPFLPLFALASHELAQRNAERVIVTHTPGFPCRVSLSDAEPGEEVLLINFEHQPASTPFRASHAIYVRQNVVAATPALNEIPAFLRTRTLSIRVFNVIGKIINAEIIAGTGLDEVIPRLLDVPAAAYLHIHNAAMGCYLARAERA